jgi:hypothetical protein
MLSIRLVVLFDDVLLFRHTKAWPVLGLYMGRVSPDHVENNILQ